MRRCTGLPTGATEPAPRREYRGGTGQPSGDSRLELKDAVGDPLHRRQARELAFDATQLSSMSVGTT
jgi:hypothetical protein